MTYNIKDLIGMTIGATDGEIGNIKDFYFEDNTWRIRYLVIETGDWLNGRMVLITTEALLTPELDDKILPVTLTKDQVRSSPDVDTQLPVYRQQEIILYDHYALGNYWRGGFVAGGMPLPMDEILFQENQDIDNRVRNDDVHLHSAVHVASYSVESEDGAVGDVKDFLVNNEVWEIDYIVVDTGAWFPGKKVIISPKWIKQIRWDRSVIIVKLTKASIKNSPEYNHQLPLNNAYARNLEAHYLG
jgi:uncharacterized protein YrrD